jgi:hypothetical protein
VRAKLKILIVETDGTHKAVVYIDHFCTAEGRIATRRKSKVEGSLDERILGREIRQNALSWTHDLNLNVPGSNSFRPHEMKLGQPFLVT